MEFGTVHTVSVLLLSGEDPARGVDGHKFFQQKKNPQFFWKKNWGGVWEKEIATTFRHVGT
jgi:hypothetical protein